MAYRWPAGRVCNRISLEVEGSCPVCGRSMHVCDHRSHHLWTCQGATPVIQPGALPGPLMRELGTHVQPRSRMVSQPAALVSGLGGVLRAWTSSLCPPWVGASASFGVTRPAPAPVVR